MTTATRLERGVLTIPSRRIPLSDERWAEQIRRGLFTTFRGERFAIPIDTLGAETFHGIDWASDLVYGTHRAGVLFRAPVPPRREGGGLRLQGTLAAVHWHRGWTDPFQPDDLRAPLDPTFATNPRHPGHVARTLIYRCPRHLARGQSRDCHQCIWEPFSEWRLRGQLQNGDRFAGFVEHLGILSVNKVTDAFVSEEIDELFVTTATEFADFDFHEVGTSTQVENNNDTALITTSGIARATGTPVDEDPDYANDATITADVTETWEEWGLFNNLTGVALFDRSLTGGQAVNLNDQVTYQYTGTLAPEA